MYGGHQQQAGFGGKRRGANHMKRGNPEDEKKRDKKVQNIIDGLREDDFIRVVVAVNELFKDTSRDTQGRAALYKLMQTVKVFSKDCTDCNDNSNCDMECSRAVAKIYASISAVASRKNRDPAFTTIKRVFEGYVIESSKEGTDLKKVLKNFLVFMELVVANAG